MIKYNFKQVIKDKGLSGRKLASLAGISPNTAALLIKAKTHNDYNISADTLDKICEVLKVQPADVLKYHKK